MTVRHLRWACGVGSALALTLTLTPCVPAARAQDVAVLLEADDQQTEITVDAQAGDIFTIRTADGTDGMELWLGDQRVPIDIGFSYDADLGDRFTVMMLPQTGTYTLRIGFLPDHPVVAPTVTPATTYERLIAKANSLEIFNPEAAQTVLQLYTAAIEVAPMQLDPYLLRMGFTLTNADEDITFSDPATVYGAYEALTEAEQARVRADVAKVIELSADNVPLQQLFMAFAALFSTGSSSANFGELLDNVNAQSSDALPENVPENEINEASAQEAQ